MKYITSEELSLEENVRAAILLARKEKTSVSMVFNDKAAEIKVNPISLIYKTLECIADAQKDLSNPTI